MMVVSSLKSDESAGSYLLRPLPWHNRRMFSSTAAGRGRCLLLLLFYLLLAVPLLRDIWAGTATVLDPPARIALSIVLLSTTCPLFAAASLSLLLSLGRIVRRRQNRDILPAENWPSVNGIPAADSRLPSLRMVHACISVAAALLAFSLAIIHLP